MTTSSSTKLPLLVIVGPTAVGKSGLALHLASRFTGEIINADSRQVYRGMEIGTAAPSESDRAVTPHHLYGVIHPADGFSLAQFIPLATQTIQAAHDAGRLPILVGGTGQYINGLVQGWTTPRVPPNPALRERLEVLLASDGVEALAARLEELDPAAAARVDTRNPRRVIRAIEVAEAIGARPDTTLQQTPPYNTFIIGLTTPSRADLHRRIDERVDAMVAGGWLTEVRSLLDQGYSADLPAMSSMGYRELVQHLAGELALEEAVRLIKVAHHRLARNQYTWFKASDPRIHWLTIGNECLDNAEEAVRGWLGNSS
ncbi:MAG: tRNA (adenosine(37)-N6)-dimethylallyltransferase MiaA [Chloroflexi bacterium]|nr:tRNA (adenosine(37)-N6)-dimethylallyltransferase MiaA [Chloroflexota bacterium]